MPAPHRRRAGRRRRVPLPAVLNALPDFALAATYLVTWFAPAALGHGTVNGLMMVLLMEFVVVQASGFMGSVALARANRAERSAGILAFAAFYTVFAGAASIGFRTWWPVAMFWGLAINRLFGVIVRQVPDEALVRFVKDGWAAAMLIYFPACFLTSGLPLPRLGLTPAAVAAQHLVDIAVWADHPEKVMAFGILYYGVFGLSELWEHAWIRSL